MGKKYISVPKNETGIYEYDYGVEYSDNLELYELTEKEFESLFGIFHEINGKLNYMIDYYESEIIKLKDIPLCMKILQNSKLTDNVFYKALENVLSYKTFVALDF